MKIKRNKWHKPFTRKDLYKVFEFKTMPRHYGCIAFIMRYIKSQKKGGRNLE